MKQKPKTKIKLTRKQSKFVDEYVKTGNGTQSANKAYDVKNNKVASVIATENLAKPSIQIAIEEALPDSLLQEKHKLLFEQVQLSYFVFPKTMENEEIEMHMAKNGLKTINIKLSDKGKFAYYSIPDQNAIKGALDMAYKLKGSYAPIKQDAKVEIVDSLTDEEKIKLKNLIK